MTSPAAGTAPPPLPRWWPTAPRLPVVKLESLKRWNEERGLWCEKGVQVLLTTVGAFAAFGLMTIAISTDYWLYTRAFICNTTNLTAGDDGPPHRGGGSEKKDPGGLTHSGLWRICCLEGRWGVHSSPLGPAPPLLELPAVPVVGPTCLAPTFQLCSATWPSLILGWGAPWSAARTASSPLNPFTLFFLHSSFLPPLTPPSYFSDLVASMAALCFFLSPFLLTPCL